MSQSHPEDSKCPFLNKNQKNPILNPRNMMPEISQERPEGQKNELSTVREPSTIPMTASESTWTYPSPQQFYNALLRRNKTAEEDMMDDVVHVHNGVNEESWKQVLEWEAMHASECATPSLQRFVGKSEEPSLKARWNEFFGIGGVLFDRHDWFVDRCGKQSVRYIIDYYDTADLPGSDPRGINVRIDTRPALDTVGAVWDRIKMALR